MKTMHRFRKKALTITAITACSLFFVASCKKYEEPEPTTEDSIDYALQVIPDIHDWAEKLNAKDLVEAMNSIPFDTIINGQNTTINICALHFGDNPPDLYKKLDDNIYGFIKDLFVVKMYIPSNPSCIYSHGDPSIPNSQPSMYVGRLFPWPYCFHFHDQHRGVAKCDFKSNFRDIGPDDYIFEIAHITEDVFIMGEGNFFTAYYLQARTKECSPSNGNSDDFTYPYDAVILSGERR